MINKVILFFASLLAGFALIKIATASVFATLGLTTFISVVGTIVVLIFSIALLYLGFKALFNKL